MATAALLAIAVVVAALLVARFWLRRKAARPEGASPRTGWLGLAAAACAGAAVAGLAMMAALELWNLAATRGHPRIVYDAIAQVRDTAIAIQARQVAVPKDYAPALTAEGARLYQEHCATCHGAPGVAPASLALGMNPLPTPIVAAARARPAREVYWLIKYGLRMSGMPAWDVRLSDAQMWTITAFAEALPDISPAGYKQFLDGLDDEPAATAQGSPEPASLEHGRRAIRMFGCHGCHEIPGVTGHETAVGPPLGGIGDQAFVAGVLENDGPGMVRWLMDPPHIDPLTAMPDLGVTRKDAEAMAAYLRAAGPKRAAAPASAEHEDPTVP